MGSRSLAIESDHGPIETNLLACAKAKVHATHRSPSRISVLIAIIESNPSCLPFDIPSASFIIQIRPGFVVFFDGRDPEIDGTSFTLPRRERRILEFLVSHAGKRVTKTQIFNAIYGLFDEEVDECVVESHISKLRKKLRSRLGFDPVDAKRYLGYQYCKTSGPKYLGVEQIAPAAEEMVAA